MGTTNNYRSALSVVVPFLLGIGSAAARDPTFDDRVKAQESIERAYYEHQIGATRSFEQAIPHRVTEKRVRTYLQQTVALERFWKTAVTGEMLERELGRMFHGTRMPERLRDLYTAVGGTSFLAQECLARPILVDRLTRGFYAFDALLHGREKADAESLRADLLLDGLDAHATDPRRSEIEFEEGSGIASTGQSTGAAGVGPRPVSVTSDELMHWKTRTPARIGEIGRLEEEREAFVVRVLLDEGPRRLRIATYTVPKKPWDEWWTEASRDLDPTSVTAVASESATGAYPAGRQQAGTTTVSLRQSPSAGGVATAATQEFVGGSPCLPDGTWDNGSLDDLPEIGGGSTAIWTGAEMILWGGIQRNGNKLNGGRKYDPATDTWTSISRIGAPLGRISHTAIWTGSEMIVWGGTGDYSNPYLNTGGRYDPVSDAWRPTSTVNAPSVRSAHTAIWTGSSMIVWGGFVSSSSNPFLNTGGIYDPKTDTWTPTSTMGTPVARQGHTAVWTGTEMVVWGGDNQQYAPYLATGGRYNPATDSWRSTATIGAPSGRIAHTAVWTGTRMVVWGGRNFNDVGTGGRYDPIGDSWTATSTSDASAMRSYHTAIWTGASMIVWGGTGPAGLLDTGARYDPGTDAWQATAMAGAPEKRAPPISVWTGSVMIIYGGGGEGSVLTTGGRYDPATDSWTPTAMVELAGRDDHSAIWTGNEMIIWGGKAQDTVNSGGRYDPATDNWSPTALTGAPERRATHTAIWTGDEMLVWGGWGGLFGRAANTGGRYDPIFDAWTPISTTGAPEARYGHTAIWTGREMVIWGGVTDNFLVKLNTGSRYLPETDLWMPISTKVAPSPRAAHVAVWTGTNMIVWGGNGIENPWVLNTGGQYDLAADSWAPTSTEGAPEARYGHTAVWTGKEVLVWGGWGGSADLNTGGRYDPQRDHWISTSTTGAPVRRSGHTAVWTGKELIVWGGNSGGGGRYTPHTDAWRSVSLQGAPTSRSAHSAVWTGGPGDLMIVWGGGGQLNNGGCYYALTSCPATTWYRDRDGDGYGSGSVGACCQPAGYVALDGDCRDSVPTIHPGAPEVCNGIDDDCNGQIDNDGNGVDSDADGVRNACDNCPTVGNMDQIDFDLDGEGDLCDLNDGILFFTRVTRVNLDWQHETAYSLFNLYRGSLDRLIATGEYTQDAGIEPEAAHFCDLTSFTQTDTRIPPLGRANFYLVTGEGPGPESSLGTRSNGTPRPNAHPCP